VVTLVASFAAVFFGQFDAVAFNLINRTDMDPISADDFHMLLNVRH
jgi:hypothetical protein